MLRWFDANRRDLPWRRTSDPYRIWLSEIMLQQTRIAAVAGRYREFLRRFPNVHALARARMSKVLAAWSGLGYYRRARALHQAARLLVATRSGRLPRTAEELESLPGIGRYTAAAIASIAFGESKAVLDGNVERVLRRVLARGDRSTALLWQLAGEMLSPTRPGDFNQAMMELGSTLCLPKRPKCPECPVRHLCMTRGALVASGRPVRRQKDISYALALRSGSVYLVKRKSSSRLMAGMWELPEISPNTAPVVLRLRHSITTTDYRVTVVAVPPAEMQGGTWVSYSRLPSLPLTGLARKILRARGALRG